MPKETLAVVKQIRKAVKTLRTKKVVDNLNQRGVAPDAIERVIKDVEVAAEVMTNSAKARLAHRKRQNLKSSSLSCGDRFILREIDSDGRHMVLSCRVTTI